MSIEKGTGTFEKTDLAAIHSVVQNTLLSSPKDIIIGILRDFYAEDSYYRYVADEWGFPKVVDHTDLESDAGINNDDTTRLFIGEAYRYDMIYYPSILVKGGGSRYTPISFNRNKETVRYEAIRVIDGYGNERVYTVPTHFVLAGAWTGQISVDIHARGMRARDDLARWSMLCFTDIRFEELLRAGIIVTGVSSSGPREEDDGNEKLYRETITLEVRSEWRREIPVENTIDAINICVDIGRVDTTPPQIAPNLTISTTIELVDQIQNA